MSNVWTWPPPAAPPSLPTFQQEIGAWQSPRNVGAILLEVASGANATLVPAPPVGFAHSISLVRAKNLSGASPAAFLATDGAGNSVAANTGLAASTQGNVFITSELWATSAINIAVSGAGGPVQFYGSYTRVPLTNNGLRLVPFVAQIALAPVALPQCVPPVGFGSALLSVTTVPAFGGAADCWVLNRDTAASTPVWQVTRSAVLWEGQFASIAVNARTSQSFVTPTLLAGDTFALRTLAAPATGTVWIGGVFAFYPLVS